MSTELKESEGLKGVAEGDEIIEPKRSVDIALISLGAALEEFLVVLDAELGRLQTTVQTFDGPNEPFSFEIEGGLTAFGAQGGTVTTHNSADGVIMLLLFKGSAKSVHTGVALKTRRARAIGHRAPIRGYKI